MDMSRATKSLLLGLIAMGIVGCSVARVTKDNYDKIQVGMTQAQVEEFMGKGQQDSGAAAALPGVSGSVAVYSWQTDDGRKNITVTFVNGKVLAKTAKGL